jgi:hypothetical protein
MSEEVPMKRLLVGILTTGLLCLAAAPGFGVGTTSATKIITLTNVGTTALTITGITITGAAAGDFSQTHTCVASLGVGASCTISVQFKPTGTGNPQRGRQSHRQWGREPTTSACLR